MNFEKYFYNCFQNYLEIIYAFTLFHLIFLFIKKRGRHWTFWQAKQPNFWRKIHSKRSRFKLCFDIFGSRGKCNKVEQRRGKRTLNARTRRTMCLKKKSLIKVIHLRQNYSCSLCWFLHSANTYWILIVSSQFLGTGNTVTNKKNFCPPRV